MILTKIISGGQTGADRTGLEEAKRLGLATGGMAPKHYRTENGSDYSLRDDFGLLESAHPDYLPRTEWNVKNSDCTVWFGNENSPGGKATLRFCDQHHKDVFLNPTDLRALAKNYRTINVAGNRKSTNPAVVAQVQRAFSTLNDDYLTTDPNATIH